MTQYDNTNTFTIGKNGYKKEDKQPDYVGKITLEDGTVKRLAGWIRQGPSGEFISGKISEIQEKQEQGQQPAQQGAVDTVDDDIPF